MHCYEYDLSPDADEFTKQWTRMALVSLAGVALYVIGIPGLFLYKLFSNRSYTIFTKSLSMLSEQVGTGELRPEKAVQRMLELANQFGHTLDRRQRVLRRAQQRKENDFLRKHTTTLTNLLQQAQKQFLLTDQSENVPKYTAMKRELVEDISNIVEQLDARIHLRSRYGFLLARWRPTAFYWELVIMVQKLLLAMLASHLESHMVIAAIFAQLVIFVAFALQLHFNPYETAQDNRLDFYVCLSSEIMLFSGVLFQQTAGPDCNANGADAAPGADLIREGLGWINVSCMIITTLIILWQLGKNVSFRAQMLAQASAGLFGNETSLVGGPAGQRVHAGTVVTQGREGAGGAGRFLLDLRKGGGPMHKGGGPISDEELAISKAEASAKADVWSAASEGARPSAAPTCNDPVLVHDDTCYRLQPPDVCARCVRAQPACLRLLAYTRQPAFLPPGDFRFMHMYLEAKMPIDQLDDKHRTPLMAAARAGATYMCAMLIAKGADVRRQDRNGWTCLHHAASAGQDKVVAYLCSQSSDLTLTLALTLTLSLTLTRWWPTSARGCRCSTRSTPTRSTRRR